MNNKKIGLIIFLVGLLVYSNSLFNSFLWDDEEQVVNNPYVHSLTNIPLLFLGSTFNSGGAGLSGLYYKPILSFSYLLSYVVFSSNAWGFHILQVIIHLTNATLVFLFVNKFLKRWTAFLLAIIFLVHPMNVEAVSYIAALQEPLFFFFGLLALNYIIQRPINLKNLTVTGLLLLMSLLSKESGILFVIIIPIAYLLRSRTRTNWQKILLSCGPSLLSTAIYLFLRLIVAKIGFGNTGPSPIMNASLTERLTTMPAIILFYIKGFFFPLNLAIAQHWVIRQINFRDFILPAILDLLFLCGLLLIGLFIKKRQPTHFRFYLFFLTWFLVGLGMHMQIIPLDMTVAERWFYFPIVGLLGILGLFFQEIKYSKQMENYLIIAVVIVISLLTTRSFIRNFNWKDGLTLYGHDIATSTNSFDLQNNLGVEQYRHGMTEQAAVHFEKSVQLAPHWWTNWNNLGVIYEQHQQYDLAAQSYQHAIDNGHYYLGYENLARLKIHHESTESAETFIDSSLKVLPQNSKLWLFKAITSYLLGDKQTALMAAHNSYALNPSQESSYLYNQILQDQPLDLNGNAK
ncbi:MAG: hypothetical protein M1607_02895 [Patescibacteria group bacterium]|nr:hypothetical protein [Patescibacteria group bacterium]